MSRSNFELDLVEMATSARLVPDPSETADLASADRESPHPVSNGIERDGILVPEHFVPTPTTISAPAQAILRAMPHVGGGVRPASRDDVEGWRAYRAHLDAGMLRVSKPYATRYPADVVTHQLSASQLYEVTPKDLAPENSDLALIYIHGGGFMVGGGDAAMYPAMQLAGMARCKVYSVDYRLVPDVTFPAPLDDCLEAYNFVLALHEAQNVSVFGPSAGANLAAAMILKARDLGVPMPAACAMHSCPSDMTNWGDSGYTNDTVDIFLRHVSFEFMTDYVGGHQPKDPYLSPVYADFTKGFPPSILSSGTRDLLLSSTVRLHRAMLRDGVKAE